MGLIKRAPDVEILVPKAVFVGQPCRVEIVIDSRDPLDIEYVEATIVGDQGWSVSAGKHRIHLAYRDRAFQIGAAISVCLWVNCGVGLLLFLRRSRSTPPEPENEAK